MSKEENVVTVNVTGVSSKGQGGINYDNKRSAPTDQKESGEKTARDS